jgi:hypothetical protein
VKIVASLVLTVLFAPGPRPRLQSPIESVSRELLGNFATGHFDAVTKDFNDELRPMVTPEVLARVKADLEGKAGTFLSVKEVHEKLQGGFRVIELIARFTKSPVSVVVVFDALDRVGAVYFNPIAPPPPDAALEASAREMIANFVAGRFDDAAKPLSPEFRLRLTPQDLSKIAANLNQIFGTFESVASVRQHEERGYKILDFKLSYSKGPVGFFVTFDPQGRIGALLVAPYREN